MSTVTTICHTPAQHTVFTPRPRVAVILAGCGGLDGTEITEAVSLITHLEAHGISPEIFAPDRPAFDLLDHTRFQVCSTTPRNLLDEANRIARGQAKPLCKLDPESFDALTFAGGFGAAKNLCTFAQNGIDAHLAEDVQKVLLPFLQAKKPVGALCISPIVVALGLRTLGYKGAHITFGSAAENDATRALSSWGLCHTPTAKTEAAIDWSFRISTAPCFMYGDATSADVYASVGSMVTGLMQLFASSSSK